jgi:MFS family permease
MTESESAAGLEPLPLSPAAELPAEAPGATRVWNRDFLLLWQGQMVSALGDTVYEIALGFWVLARTGSTALMGTLMAATTLPRILVAPFAGVVVDRSDRRGLAIAMDIIRGLLIVLVALAAYAGIARVWMVFAAGIAIGACGAFFGPAVTSALPDIVPRSGIIQANSAFNIIYTGSGIVGNAGGGFLYQLLGAPLMFLLNGLSYIVSAASLLFIRIPRIVRERVRPAFFAEMRQGLSFVWGIRGLRFLFLCALALNFFATIGIVLFLPLFQRTAGLGPERYGVTMALFMGGLFLGFLLGATLRIEPRRRFAVFFACGIVMSLCLAAFPLIGNWYLMLGLMLVGGLVNAVLNNYIGAIVQLIVPQDMRGKVFSLLGAISQAATPLGMALGGVLGQFLPLRHVISGSFVVMLLCFIPLLFSDSFRRFINFDPDHDTLSAVSAD